MDEEDDLADGIERGIERGTLQQHFDVEKVFPGKCNVSICYKLRDKRFLLKNLPKHLVELQEFADRFEGTHL